MKTSVVLKAYDRSTGKYNFNRLYLEKHDLDWCPRADYLLLSIGSECVAVYLNELKEAIAKIEEDSPKFLPCPFCGHKDIDLITTSLQDYSKYECWCHSCGISGPGSRDKSRAIESWNRRV